MANAIISRLGVVNAADPAGSAYTWAERTALFKDVFAGEVLTAFAEKNVFKDLHMERTISSGKSASFPATWKLDARYHVPGTPILGSNKLEIKERTIKIDDVLIADAFIYDLDDAMAHYDVRQIHSTELGAAMAREYDKRVAQVLVNAARASGNTASSFGGSRLTNANAKTDGEVLAGMIFSAAQVLDEKDVSEDGRFVVVKPAQYYLLAQTTKVLNRDWGGSGVYADGTVLRVAGVQIVKSNNLPTTDIASSIAGEQNDYTGDFTTTAGVVATRQAAGTVKLMDLAMEMSGSDFHLMYHGTLMKASQAIGHGILRPECAVELATGDIT